MIKNSPLLKDLENYEQWREDVLMWREVTDLSKNKHALAVYLKLKGQAKDAANQVPTDVKKKDDQFIIFLADENDEISNHVEIKID